MSTLKVDSIVTEGGSVRDFSYKDLNVYHDDCGGGRIVIRPPEDQDVDFQFSCKRCMSKISVPTDVFAAICKTAIDAEPRTFGYITIEQTKKI